MNINRFRDHKVNETLGIIEATLFYVDIIKSKVLSEILDYIDTNPDVLKTEQKEIVIPYTNIRRFVTNWMDYTDFPVTEIIIDLSMVKKPANEVKRKDIDTKEEVQTPIKVGGYASSFAKGRERAATRFKEPIKMNTDHSLSIHMGIEFICSTIFIKYRHTNMLETKIESVVLHELNHVYEYYKRKMSGYKNIPLTTTWASIGDNRMRRPKVIWDYWQNNFTEYIYMAEPHEMRAYIQEAKAYVDSLDLPALKRTNLWKLAKLMENFDCNKFRMEFNKFIYKYNPEYVNKIIDSLVVDFIRDYKRLSIEFKEDGNNNIKPSTLEKMSTDEFFDFWEKRIKKSGKTLIRKILKLYIYKRSKEDDFIA